MSDLLQSIFGWHTEGNESQIDGDDHDAGNILKLRSKYMYTEIITDATTSLINKLTNTTPYITD